MGDILEILFAIVAGFFWLFGGSLFKKRKKSESSEPTSSQPNNEREDDQPFSDQEARQREIREAIRRKIEERRQPSGSEPVVALEPEPQYQDYSESSEPQAEADGSLVYAESAADETFSWDVGGNAYEQEMQARLEEIEATKRQAEALKKKIKQDTQDYYDTDHHESAEQEHVLSVGAVHSALKNPQSVRAAFIYGEVLGKPVGLRNPSETGLGG
jgi:hypothetical protein